MTTLPLSPSSSLADVAAYLRGLSEFPSLRLVADYIDPAANRPVTITLSRADARAYAYAFTYATETRGSRMAAACAAALETPAPAAAEEPPVVAIIDVDGDRWTPREPADGYFVCRTDTVGDRTAEEIGDWYGPVTYEYAP